jgi:S1-C subfamily serine protease
MIARTVALASFLLLSIVGCTRNSDDALVAAVHRIAPSVVLLTMKIPPEHKRDKYDEAFATGFVIASGAWGSDILTVAHAVDGAWDLHVTLGNHKRVPARVIATNADKDVALLRTKAANLAVVKLGSSHDLRNVVGRQIGLLGYPVPDEFEDEDLGLATSLSSGLLSAVRNDAIEVTVAVIPGDSGGPIFLADTGDIVGLADSRFDDEPSIGFAVPVDDARTFLHRVDRAHGF